MSSYDWYRRIVHWLLTVLTVIYVVSGFGITEFRMVGTLTFGLLTKNVAFKIHDNLEIPFLILLVLHICSSSVKRLLDMKRNKQISRAHSQ